MCETMVDVLHGHKCHYRWRPKMVPRNEHELIIKNAVEDSYKRLILPFLSRSYRYVWYRSYVRMSITSFLYFLLFFSLIRCVHLCLLLLFLFPCFSNPLTFPASSWFSGLNCPVQQRRSQSPCLCGTFGSGCWWLQSGVPSSWGWTRGINTAAN